MQLPIMMNNTQGETRRLGVEFEFAGLMPADIGALVVKHFGGSLEWQTLCELRVVDTAFGKFKIELDSLLLKELGKATDFAGDINQVDAPFEAKTVDWFCRLANELVPWELVTPPIPFDQLEQLLPLVEDLRTLGAKGTRYSVAYAFGLHLNPEVPNLDVTTILNYLRAFFCLYDAIIHEHSTDLTRRLTSYVDHFGTDYVLKVVDWSYQPTQAEFIDDYLRYNPTRNRSLDLLPLLCCLDDARVRSAIDDVRVKARPTFHYRLPDCDIDNPQWNLHVPWSDWLIIESLVHHSDALQTICAEFREERDQFTYAITTRWSQRVRELVSEFC